MAPVDLLFGPVVVLPVDDLWDGKDVDQNHSKEVVSHEDGDCYVADIPTVNNAPAVASLPSPTASEGEEIG